MSRIKKILLTGLFVISTMGLHAKSYNSWHLLYPDTYGLIKRIKDATHGKKIIEFQSKSSRDTYINGAKTGKKAWNNRKDKIIKWDLNFNKNFVIIVSTKTINGYRDLIYTSGEDNGNLYFGLGKYLVKGTWQTITRDLEDDLHKYEPHNEIISVNAFLIRGSGRIGTIEMLSSKKEKKVSISKDKNTLTDKKVKNIVKNVEEKIKNIIRKEQESQESKEKKNSKKEVLKIEPKDENSLAPRILLEEGNLIYHKLGEPFFDPGATAIDYEGVMIDIDVIGEVDINKVNRYVLSYIATDENGYTTTKARVVMVHKAGEEVKPKLEKIKVKRSLKSRKKEQVEHYEELIPLSPLNETESLNMGLDEELMYYD
jgi:hypothetical protein